VRLTRGSYANVTATLALVVALGGTGYAAAELAKNSVGTKQLQKNAVTSKKVDNGSLLAKDFKAGQLPQGPAGPAGAPGAPGAQGPAGPLVDTLPSGKTLRGAWVVGGLTDAAGEVVQEAISYPFALAANVTVHTIVEGNPIPAQCPGTPANPQAQAGHLCVYQDYRSNSSGLNWYGTDGSGLTRYGISLYTNSSAAGKVETSGTWAVTAP
jgi:hypothetical protein